MTDEGPVTASAVTDYKFILLLTHSLIFTYLASMIAYVSVVFIFRLHTITQPANESLLVDSSNPDCLAYRDGIQPGIGEPQLQVMMP